MINKADRQYCSHMRDINSRGRIKGDRTGTGTKSIFGHQMRFDLREGLPLITTKEVNFNSILHELLWFLKGDTNVKYLKDNNVNIWNEWADPNGDLGPVYGAMWRSWPNPVDLNPYGSEEQMTDQPIDQLQGIVDALMNTPNSRRLIVSGWNPALLPVEGESHENNVANGKQVLPPCHTLFQFMSEEMTTEERLEFYLTRHMKQYDSLEAKKNSVIRNKEMIPSECMVSVQDYTQLNAQNNSIPEVFLTTANVKDKLDAWMDAQGIPKRFLSCQMYQRSADWFLGVPYNMASYAALTEMMAKITGHVAKDFIHTFGDSHLYMNHFEQVNTQLLRESDANPLPTLQIHGNQTSIDDFKFSDFELLDYNPHPPIKAPISV